MRDGEECKASVLSMEERVVFFLSLPLGQRQADLWVVLRCPTKRARVKAGGSMEEPEGNVSRVLARDPVVTAVITLVSPALSQSAGRMF